MNKALQHITLTTGHTRRSPRSEVSDHVIDRLSPVVEAGGGLLGVGDWRIDIVSRQNGYAVWHIGSDRNPKEPWVSCAACWDLGAISFAWANMATTLKKVGFPVLVPTPKEDMPWLAVAFLPGIVAVPLDDIMALGDAERCIAWTLIEREGGFHQR